MSISKHRLRYIEDALDRFLNTLFKDGEMIEIIIMPGKKNSTGTLEVTIKDVSDENQKNGT